MSIGNTGPSILSRFYRLLSGKRKRQLALVMILMALGAIAEVMTIGAVIPFLTIIAGSGETTQFEFLAPVVNALGWEHSGDLLLPFTLLFGLAAFICGMVRVGLTWMSNVFVYGLGNDLATKVYKTILYQPYAYHLDHNSSEIVGSINKIQLVINNIIFHLMRSIVSVFIASCILIALLAVEPVVAFSSMLAIGSIFVSVRLVTSRYLKRNSRVISEMQSKRIQVVQEGVGGIREVIIDRIEPLFVEKFQKFDGALQRANLVNFSIARTPRYVVEALGMIIIAIMAFILVKQSDGATTALPILGVLALGAQRMLPLLQDTYQAWAHITGNKQVLVDVVELLELPVAKERFDGNGANDAEFDRSIELSNISFRYNNDQAPVLHDINLSIDKGSVVGIMGKTGSGKSTIIDLIMGLQQPTSGKITIDGHVLDKSRTGAWQKQIAHVPQTIFLQDASIAQNIAFGIDPECIDMDQVRQAARLAQISEYIESQPEGYSAMVGERGIRMSGGQRQRIGIARALYKQAAVLVLDEATSALDSFTEAAVMEAIKTLPGEITVVLIAHRLSTMQNCDRVVELDHGRVVAEGSFAEVVSPKPGADVPANAPRKEQLSLSA